MKVKQAEYIDDYKIKMMFSNGVVKIVDFGPFLRDAKHVFVPLRSLSYFKQFHVDDITLSWPNGADFDPELLYDMGTSTKGKSVKSAKSKGIPKPRSRKKTQSSKLKT